MPPSVTHHPVTCTYPLHALPSFDHHHQVGEDGVEEAFELLHELPDRVRTGQWVGDCFIYTNNAQRLNYYVGGQVGGRAM